MRSCLTLCYCWVLLDASYWIATVHGILHHSKFPNPIQRIHETQSIEEIMTIQITDVSHDDDFARKVEEISGENIHKCMQCGTCTGGCPMVGNMQMTPRQILLLSHYGMKEKLSDTNTVWLCASCSMCFSRCPRGLDIPKIMEAIRQVTLRENENHIEPGKLPKDLLRDAPQIALVSCFRKHTS